jgi:hypothetical protein
VHQTGKQHGRLRCHIVLLGSLPLTASVLLRCIAMHLLMGITGPATWRARYCHWSPDQLEELTNTHESDVQYKFRSEVSRQECAAWRSLQQKLGCLVKDMAPTTVLLLHVAGRYNDDSIYVSPSRVKHSWPRSTTACNPCHSVAGMLLCLLLLCTC